MAKKRRLYNIPAEAGIFKPYHQWASIFRLAMLVFLLLGFTGLLWAAQADISNAGKPALIPMPREYFPRGPVTLAHGVSVKGTFDAEDHFAAQDLAKWLAERSVLSGYGHSAVLVELLRTDSRRARKLLSNTGIMMSSAMHDEGYAILPTTKGLTVIADTAAGVFYGAQTVKQLVLGNGPAATLQKALIRDWPAMHYRGISDDLSRGPLPTLAFQERQIRTLATYKVNIYSPYFENTLQYNSNPVPSLPDGSMSHEDVRELVLYAKRYHVTIVPEQEAFGHLHHLLKYQEYASLAETPMGNVLAPGQPGSLDLIGQWFDEIAELFPSPLLHIGADETSDLGKGQTQAAVTAQGLGAVYVDFLLRIHQKLAPLNRRLLFWGDIAMNDPEQVKRLPKDMIAVAWTYDPEPNGYTKWLKPYVDADMETWVAPGVSNWSHVYPDNYAALQNIQGFVRDGQAAHSTGLLNTIWNDDGEGLFQEDWYGVLFGAAAGWQPGTSSIPQFQAAYGRVFHGDVTGNIDSAQSELAAVYKLLAESQIDVSTDELYWVDPWSAKGMAAAKKLRPFLRAIRLHAERTTALLAQARAADSHLREQGALDAMELGARKLDFIGQKFEVADLLAEQYQRVYSLQNDHQKAEYISDVISSFAGNNGLCEDLRDAYTYDRLQFSQLWLNENRPYWLQNVLVRYDLATQVWVKRSETLQTIREEWDQGHSLPSPSSLGIPSPPVN